MTLHEVAQRLGVETRHRTELHGYQGDPSRPDKDIAHDVFNALRLKRWCWLESNMDKRDWSWHFGKANDPDHESGIGTFEEAVTALAERYLESK